MHGALWCSSRRGRAPGAGAALAAGAGGRRRPHAPHHLLTWIVQPQVQVNDGGHPWGSSSAIAAAGLLGVRRGTRAPGPGLELPRLGGLPRGMLASALQRPPLRAPSNRRLRATRHRRQPLPARGQASASASPVVPGCCSPSRTARTPTALPRKVTLEGEGTSRGRRRGAGAGRGRALAAARSRPGGSGCGPTRPGAGEVAASARLLPDIAGRGRVAGDALVSPANTCP